MIYSFIRDGQRYTIHPDGLGSVRMVTDPTGAVVARSEYGAWGELLPGSFDSVPGGMPFGFVGALGVRTDATTGLIWMRNRWYSSTLQRFISRDPIGLRGGENLYSYVGSNPIRFTDPSGQFPIYGTVGEIAATIDMITRIHSDEVASDILTRANEQGNISGIRWGNDTSRTHWDKVSKELFIDPRDAQRKREDDPKAADPKPGVDPCLEWNWYSDSEGKNVRAMWDGDADGRFANFLHEIGHAATGAVDEMYSNADLGMKNFKKVPGLHKMGNIVSNENPLRLRLGLPLRLEYLPGQKPTSDYVNEVVKFSKMELFKHELIASWRNRKR